MKKQLVILTISDKHNDKYDRNIPDLMKNGGYCIAGFEVGGNGEWIRLIGKHEHFKITNEEAVYENGVLCEPFDVIEVDCMKMDEELWSMGMAHGWGEEGSPWLHFVDYDEELLSIQPENYIVKDRFKIIRKMAPEEFFSSCSFYDRPYIFTNKWSSLPVSLALDNAHSLALVKVSELVLMPEEKKNTDSAGVSLGIAYKNHYKASFRYAGNVYGNITVTDPDYDARSFDYEVLELGDRTIVMSLGEKFPADSEDGRHYKLIAKIFDDYDMPENSEDQVTEEQSAYPYEGPLGIMACMSRLKELFDINDSAYTTPLKKKMLDMLEEEGYIYRDHGIKPTEYGIKHGMFQTEAVTQKGEPYFGLFYDREPQELMYSYAPVCLQEIRSELEERNFNLHGERVSAVFNGIEISFKRKFSDHIFTTDELNRLIAGEIISINYDLETRSCRGRLMKKNGEHGEYYAFTPDFDNNFTE